MIIEPKRLVCSTLPFTHDSLEKALERVRRCGFDQVELVVRGDGVWPGHVDPQRLLSDPDYKHHLTEIVRKSKMKVVSAGCEMAKDISLENESQRHQCLCAWLSSLGAKYLTIFIYDHPHAKARWKALKAIAKDNGMILCAETHLGTALAQPKETIEMAEALDLSITLDASHYIGQGFEPQDWERLFPRVTAVQVRHCRKGELQEPFSSMEALSASLKQLIPHCYEGPVVLEQIHNFDDPEWDEQIIKTKEALVDLVRDA